MYKCPVCGAEFADVSKLKSHFKKHKLGGICPICGKKVRSLSKHCSWMYKTYGCKEHGALAYLLSSSKSWERDRRKAFYIEIREVARSTFLR